jgi:GMP synthase (glutamine-hydrolysing)
MEIRAFDPKGIILSGGPRASTTKAPLQRIGSSQPGVPVLGICYGMQYMAHALGGAVEKARDREYGNAFISIKETRTLFHGFSRRQEEIVWMSHGDRIDRMPEGFKILASSKNSPVSAMADPLRKLYGVQFHPEVAHTPNGTRILKNFLFKVCGCEPLWTMSSFVERTIHDLRENRGERVICGISGGVDSTITAVLLHKAIGSRSDGYLCGQRVAEAGRGAGSDGAFPDLYHVNIHKVDSSAHFLRKLKGVTDPEKKRKIIGREFIAVFEKKAKELGSAKYLAQGTLYPDVIESVSFKGPSATIKSHHNVGGLPEVMKLELIEPLRELFKDEGRQVGMELGLPREMVMRQPFPGPGLAVRILGEITPERLEILRSPMPSSWMKSGEPTCTRRCGNPLRCFSLSRPWASWGTSEPMRTLSPSELWTAWMP